MARFLYHAPCPRCNSKDNLGVYDDGSVWCFGCHYRGGITTNPHLQKQQEKQKHPFPIDLIQEYPLEVIKWITKYNITVSELINRNVYWSPSKQSLLFIFKEYNDRKRPQDRFGAQRVFEFAGARCVAVGRGVGPTSTRFLHCPGTAFACGRNFYPGHKSKYINYGEKLKETIYPHQKDRSDVQAGRRRFLVLVEDCLSAIKIARQNDAAPLLTSTLGRNEINRLAGLYDGFLVWLDGNMYHKAMQIAWRFQILGKKASAIYTPKDPKCYSDSEIRNLLTIPSNL